MRGSNKLMVAVSSVAVGLMLSSGAFGQVVIDRNNTAGNLNVGAQWDGGVVPGATNIARWTSTSALANPLGANLTFGGLRLTNPTGPVNISANTLTLGRFGVDMSAATADLTVASGFSLSAQFRQTWNVQAGRTLTFSANMIGSNTTSGSVLISGAGTVRFTGANVSPNDILGPGTNQTTGQFIVNGGRDFAAVDGSNNVIAGLSSTIGSTRYGANPATGTDVPVGTTIPAIFNFTNFNDNAITGLRANANIFPNGWRFNTPTGPNPLARDWVIDASSSNTVNRQLGGNTLGVLMGPELDTNVSFIYSGAAGQGGSGFRLGNRLGTFPLRNYSNFDLNVNVQISQATGGGVDASVFVAGPGRVNFGNSIFLNGAGSLFVDGGTAQFRDSLNAGGTITNSGTFASTTGSIIVNSGNLLLNSSVSVTARPITVNSGGTLGGTASTTGTVTLNSGASYSPGNAGVNSNVGSQTFAGLTLASGSALTFDFASLSLYDQVTITNPGGLIASGGAFTLIDSNTANAFSTDGVYTLFNINGGIGGNVSNLAVANPVGGKSYTFSSGAAGLFLTISSAVATPVYWNINADGNWGAANWTAAFPNGVGAIASFGGGGTPITAPRVVTVESAKTVGRIDFNSAVSFTVGGTAPLTLDNGIASAPVNVIAGSHTIAAPVALTANGTGVDVASTAQLTVSGNITGAGDLSKSGLGRLILTGAANTYTNTFVNGGTLQVGNGPLDGSLGSGTINVASGATIQFVRDSTYNFTSQIAGTGSVEFGGNGVVTLAASAIAPNASQIRIFGGKVVLGDFSAIGQGASPTPNPTPGQNVVVDAGTLDLNQNAQIYGVISGNSGEITDLGGSPGSTLLVFHSAGTGVFNGQINDGPNRFLSVVKTSPNTANSIGFWTLGGVNNFSGGLLIEKGDLTATNGDALGTGDVTISAAGTNASARSRLIVAGNLTIDNNFIINGRNTNGTGVISLLNATDTVTLTGSIKQNAGNLGATTSQGGTVQGPTGGLLILAGPILASDPGLAEAFVINGSSGGGNVRFSFPGGGPVGNTSGLVILNNGAISLGVNDGVAPEAELRLGNSGGTATSFDLRGFNQTLRQLTRGGGTSVPSVLNSSATTSNLTLLPDVDFTYAGNITGNINVAHGGANTITFSGATTFTGNTTASGAGGRIVFGNTLRPVTGSLVVTGAGASVQLTSARSAAYTRAGEFAGLTVGATGSVSVPVTTRGPAAATAVVSTGTLSIAAGGFLDLGNNDLVVTAGDVAAIRSAVATWYNAGTPGTTGLGASAANPAVDFTTLAVFPNSTNTPGVGYYNTYDGVTTGADAVIVKFTYIGDTNIDGILDANDLISIIEGISLGRTGWQNGDLDYNGAVTSADLTLFLSASTAVGVGSLGNGLGLADDGGASGAIPEPTSLGLLMAAAPLMTRRRR